MNYSIQLPGGKTIGFDIGKYAKQASGSAMTSLGQTMVLTTVCAAETAKEDIDFLPLQVEYRERMSAAGKIPGGYFRREGKPSEKEVLSARIVDRPIRPMFPKNWYYETQIVAFIECSDQQNDADVLAVCGASLSLLLSEVPFAEAIGAVRVARSNGNSIINPTFDELKEADYEFIVAGTKDSIVMVEGESDEISEQEYLEALRVAADAVKTVCEGLERIARESGIAKTKRVLAAVPDYSQLEAKIETLAAKDLRTLARTVLAKDERATKTTAVKDGAKAALKAELGEEKYAEVEKVIAATLKKVEKREMREMILSDGIRLDGRNTSTIRPITIEVGVLPRAHGSSLFTRGETQSLSTATLGSKRDEQNIEGLGEDTTKRFMLHYNFPPFSVGEVGRMTGTGRREIGHGNLAERALKGLLPPSEEFPYTMRIVSDILESNGSSSMATVCAGSLALFDAGVALKKPVAGIAMGLIKEETRSAVLSDILGNEDFLGDMDFKVCGTRDGITACQMDMKIKGIDFALLEKALMQAKEGRLFILGKMDEVLSAPRADLSQYAPRMTAMKIPVEMIGLIIGPGGKMIREIQSESGVEDITIEDDGTLTISAIDGTSAKKAQDMIEGLIRLPEEGTVYRAKVTQVREGLGAIMEFLPKKEGLMHISEIDYNRVENISDVIQVGDEFDVKLIAVKPDGKFSLSRKALLEKPEGYVERPPRQGGGNGYGGGRGGDRRGGGGYGDRRGGGGYDRGRR
ncbi:MAG TPA: polyribonucleotide nucleotidyltransferase [Candidatus Kapabacteria bacterium]|nr:polyribonucleotide nucleotidyltransferase [Candidatus Kapabacteria bacterium]